MLTFIEMLIIFAFSKPFFKKASKRTQQTVHSSEVAFASGDHWRFQISHSTAHTIDENFKTIYSTSSSSESQTKSFLLMRPTAVK